MLQGKKILVGISGSIAAYKSASLIRLLVKAEADVKVVMTPAATGFITPLSLSTLSRHEVLSEIATEDSWANHVMLGRWADVMLIAPLSCNSLAKMATGSCDNLLMAVYLSATCPVIVAPAMDEDMWHHPATKRNIHTIEQYGNRVIPVEHGELASGLTGDGRMAEPEQIVAYLERFFLTRTQLAGKKVLITAGPTYEAIDPVRFIGNHSSGKMGFALAAECHARGAEVLLVSGPVSLPAPAGVTLQKVTSAADMYDACMKAFPATDISILSAAVADYRVEQPAQEKIKKKEEALSLQLTKTTDILQALGRQKQPNQILVGFALETQDARTYALGKLEAKNADVMVMNNLRDAGAGFGHDTNKITIFDRRGTELNFEVKSKSLVAADIINHLYSFMHA